MCNFDITSRLVAASIFIQNLLYSSHSYLLVSGQYGAYLGHNKEIFGALFKSIIGNLKGMIGPGLIHTVKYFLAIMCTIQ